MAVTVFYDANVLYPAPLRDFLMHLSLTDLIKAKWSNMVHDEWMESLMEKRFDLNRSQLERTRELMNQNVHDALVTGFEHLIDDLLLPDPNDRHVLAAAIHAGANLIITFNLKDFPEDYIAKFGLEVEHPDEFIYQLFNFSPPDIILTAQNHRNSLKNPPKTAEDYLQTLEKQGLTKTVGVLKDYIEVI